MGRGFSREEVAEIIRRAAERERAGQISEEDLAEVAAEVGLDPDAVRHAAAEVASERIVASRQGAVAREQRRRLGRALWSFVLTNATVVAVDLLTGGGLWFYWVTLGTGVLLANRLVRTFAPSDRDVHEIEQYLEDRERQRAERARRKAQDEEEREKRAQRRKKLGRVVEDGVDVLLDAAADHIEKYQQGSKGESRPPRTRVAQDDLDADPEREARGRRRASR